MTVTATMLARLRRMVNEPDDTNDYDDAALTAIVEGYPVSDADGNDPDDNDWTDTYDLHRAAADIWEEKASVVAADFDFSADGGRYDRSQVYQQYTNLAHYHAARARVRSGRMVSSPTETPRQVWIGNLPEVDE